MKQASPSPENSLSLLPVALVYFILFFVSILANASGRFLVFPKIQDGFQDVMLVDAFFSLLIAGMAIGILQIVDRKTRLFHEVTSLFHHMFAGIGLRECFLLAAFSALGEEFFFRGFIQSHVGLVMTSLVFGLAHVGPRKSFWPWTLSAIFLGLLLGYMYELRQNILVPVIIHFLINFINLSFLSQSPDAVREGFAERHPT